MNKGRRVPLIGTRNEDLRVCCEHPVCDRLLPWDMSFLASLNQSQTGQINLSDMYHLMLLFLDFKIASDRGAIGTYTFEAASHSTRNHLSCLGPLITMGSRQDWS